MVFFRSPSNPQAAKTEVNLLQTPVEPTFSTLSKEKVLEQKTALEEAESDAAGFEQKAAKMQMELAAELAERMESIQFQDSIAETNKKRNDCLAIRSDKAEGESEAVESGESPGEGTEL